MTLPPQLGTRHMMGNVWETFQKHRQNIMFEHTIFALPFAYLGLFLGAGGWPGWALFGWVTLAMIGARTAAMSLNRVIDAEIDAHNPRTAQRLVPTGQLSRRSVILVAGGGLILLLVAAWQINPLCFILSPIAVVALVGYSYTKRFTWLCHFALGMTDAMAPAGGWLAADPNFTAPMLLLAFAVGIWIAGFDIIYACQDVEFDRQHGIQSIPARFGIPTALRIAQACHRLMVLALLGVGVLIDGGVLYGIGVVATAALLIYEHSLVSPDDMSHINVAFFTVNSWIASVLFIFTLGDIFL